MLTVAKGIDGPIKLLFPHKWAWSLLLASTSTNKSPTLNSNAPVASPLNSTTMLANSTNTIGNVAEQVLEKAL